MLIARAVDNTHAASADLFQYPVMSQRAADHRDPIPKWGSATTELATSVLPPLEKGY